MNEQIWAAVDNYLGGAVGPQDAALSAALAANTTAGLPAIDVTPGQGKLLYLYAKALGARRILEIGTLGGYSTLWLARALPADGKVVTLEVEPKHAEVARRNFASAGVAAKVELILGRAIDSLVSLSRQRVPAFDFVFIDADKVNTLEYFRAALDLCRPGALIFVDNVVRKGHVADANSTDPNVRGMRRFVDALAAEKRVEATAIQTVGGKGYDGFILARVCDGEAIGS